MKEKEINCIIRRKIKEESIFIKCEIRKWKTQDAQDLSRILNNKKILDNLRDGIPYPYTKLDALEFINTMNASDENKVFSFAIISEGRVIGSIAAFRGDNIHSRTAELGYYLAEEYWSKGIMTEAVKKICDYIFSSTDIIRIFAEPFEKNKASCRVLGFTYFFILIRTYMLLSP